MTYATQQDLVDRFGTEQLAQLSDRTAGAVIDTVVVGRALSDADAEIDSYLAAVYTLPLGAVPSVLVRVACDIARYRLFGDRVTEQVRQLYTDAVRDLKAIVAGTIKIDGAVTLTPSVASETVKVKPPARMFGSDVIGGY